jgi:hypothetical protein
VGAAEHPAGWYLDPVPGAPPRQHRYWTGTSWTFHVATPVAGPVRREPAPEPAGRNSWRIPLVAAALIVVILAGALGIRALRSDDRYPETWDRRVAPIAARVAALRGLAFEHPVRVRYLTDAEFRRKVGVETMDLSPAARRRMRQLAGTLRALGLLDADANLVKSFDTANQSGVVAYYDPTSKVIVVRGTGRLDIDRKATLAHELTHVLQDQHFGLDAMRADARSSDGAATDGALTALIEGDAERIKTEYLAELPQADRRAYDAAQTKADAQVDREMADVAQIVKIELGAPYAFGPDVLAALTAKGGNSAVDDALRRPAPSDKIYLDPTAAMEDLDVVHVAVPVLGRGERRVGAPDELGAFELFTLLASRIDRQVALDAADTWAGDRMVTYRSRGQVCVRATIASTTPSGAGKLARALDSWAATMPDATVSGSPRSRTTLDSCDTGANPPPESAKLAGALMLLGGRNGLLASLLERDVPTAVGECVARGLAKSPLFVDTLERGNDLSPSEQRQARLMAERLLKDCSGHVPS